MPRQIPTNPASCTSTVGSKHSYAPQQQPSRLPGEQSRSGQNQHAARHQTQYPHSQVQPTQYQTKPCQITVNIQPRQHRPTTHHVHPHTQAVVTQASQHHRPNLHPSYPDPGPPDGFITENGRKIPIWYNPPGIVDKDMSPHAQAEYDRVRQQIVNGNRR